MVLIPVVLAFFDGRFLGSAGRGRRLARGRLLSRLRRWHRWRPWRAGACGVAMGVGYVGSWPSVLLLSLALEESKIV